MKSFVPTHDGLSGHRRLQKRFGKITISIIALIFSILGAVSVSAQTTSFNFTQIPSSTEVPGPGRGLQTWIGLWQIEYPTAGAAMAGNVFDDYYRFYWSDIQDENGNFTWTAFDTKIRSAITNGRKFDFAVMPVYNHETRIMVGGSNLTYPTFLHNQMQAETVKDWISASAGAWIPDWNSNSYLTALENLVKGIADHINTTSYNGIPYSKVVNIIDMRGYGNFGEGHTYPWTSEITANRQLTIASAKRMIDAYLNAFPNNQIVVCHEFFGGVNDGNAPQDPAIGYYALTAKNAHGEMGWRRDSWGWQAVWFPGMLEANTTTYNGVTFGSLISNKWKAAPVTGEPMPCCTTDNGYSIYGGLSSDMTKYHATSFGNGNYQTTTDATAIANVRAAGRLTGYRLVLTGGSVPSTITPGTPFTLNLAWQNLGVAPTYESWEVYYELRNASNTAVWSGKSAFTPRLFLPASAATTASDNFTVPATVASGSYKLVVVVKDPNGYRQPLPLAINGRASDGSYPLATVNVGAGGSTTNQAPTANAGNAITVNLPANTATLTGTGTDADGTVSGYAWSQLSGPASATIASPNSASTNISALVAGTYTFQLTVTDNGGATATATVTVTVAAANKAPLVSAGSAISVTLPANTATLTGTATDSDGSIASYAWTKVSGPTGGAISTPAAPSTVITGLLAGTYTYKLTATDNQGATGSATVTVTVAATPNIAPTVSAGVAQTITLPTSSVTATGTASDADGTITTYAWSQVSGPATATIASPSAASTSITGLTTAGTYIFKLTATDNSGAANSSNLTVTVNAAANKLPTVNAGTAQSITLPTSTVTLTGTATDADGTIATYAWTLVSGPATPSFAKANEASTTVSGLTTAGSYVFKLTATDNNGGSASANVTVTVNLGPNVAPTANAGSDISITLPTNTATLTGSGSDADGTISAYGWTKVSGPAGGTIASPKSANTNITGLLAGTYVFRLTVTDDRGGTASDDVNVTVSAAPTTNQTPTANAGSNITVTLPTSTTTLTGSGTDADGTIATYAWSQLSGPGASTIENPASASTNISGLIAGTYVFRLTVTDNGGLSSTSDVQVTVNPAPTNNGVNRLPVANAGQDQTLTLPTNSTSLNGSASSDPDGTISAYSWSQLSGPTTATLGSSGSVSTTVSNLAKGTYQFQLTVWDDKNATSTAKVLVVVTDANQKAVIKFASDTINVTLPVNNAVLDASASFDPDGVINAYEWTLVNGPSTPAILSPSASKTTVNNLAAGTYVFNLAATDNKGAVSNLTTVIVVSYSNTRIASQAFAIYPNPVQSAANISLNSDMEGKASYQVTDMNGRPLLTGEFTKVSGSQTLRVDMNNLRPGVYFLKLQVNDVRVGVKKLMKL